MSSQVPTNSSTPNLGLTIRESLRYGFTGSFILIALCVVWPAKTPEYLIKLGSVSSFILILSSGAVFYTFVRTILGAFVFYPISDALHRFFRLLFVKKAAAISCTAHYMMHVFGVRYWTYRDAFALIRDQQDLIPERAREQLHVRHSELHLAYCAAVIAFSAGWRLYIESRCNQAHGMIALGAALLITALLGDIELCRAECLQLKLINKYKVTQRLRSAGLIEAKQQGRESAS